MLVHNLELSVMVKREDMSGASTFDVFFLRLPHADRHHAGIECEIVAGNGSLVAQHNDIDVGNNCAQCAFGMEIFTASAGCSKMPGFYAAADR